MRMNRKINNDEIDFIKAKEELKTYLNFIQEKYVSPYFKKIQYSSIEKSRRLKTVQIKEFNDLSNIPNQPGFYVIFSNIAYDTNECVAVFKNKKHLKAIYRGESYTVQERIKSHLFNNKYIETFEGSKRLDVTLLIEGVKVNIDLLPYKNYEWYVVYHAAPNSTSNIRRMMELEFDKNFGKPLYSNN